MIVDPKMASWDDTNQGNDLEECPVCMVKLCKKKMVLHLTNCIQKNGDDLDELGLIRCPLYPLHIMPKNCLNHHLECSCEEALNSLRQFFQHRNLSLPVPPADFLSSVPDSLLNQHNKQLLFYLKRDIYGCDISQDKELYPESSSSGGQQQRT